jgi:hypothetical protein
VSLPDELNQAIGYLRDGNPELARPILVHYLQGHPRSDVGWYLLSFAIPEHERQIESLHRALAINPDNDKARTRLASLTGMVPPDAQKTEAVPPARGAARMSAVAGQSGRGVASSRRVGRQWPPWVKPTAIVASIVLVVAAIASAYAFIRFAQSTLGRRQSVAATSRAQTATVRATLGASVGLPASWTPTMSLTPSATSEPSSTPTVTATATPAPPDPTTLAEMATIQAQVADLRGLTIEANPPSYVITVGRVRPFLESSFIAGGGSEEDVADLSHTLVALGLTKPTYDLYTNILNGLTDSIGGFYLPWSKEIFIIGNRFSGVERWVYSHEFDHALVDQHYHIDEAGVYPLCERSSDECKAVEALVEGDATLLMSQWLNQYAGPQDISDILRYKPPTHTLPNAFPPPYAAPDSLFPYDHGLTFVKTLYESGNWAEVNQAYEDLPTSTEQIMHVDKYLNHEDPIDVPPRDVAGLLNDDWRVLTRDTLGEWTTYLMLAYSADQAAQVDFTVADRAARGWGGDTYQVFFNDGTEQAIMTADWVWDSPPDAVEFKTALERMLANRYRGGELPSDRGRCWSVGDETSCVLSSGTEVVWILGPTDMAVGPLMDLFPELR